MSIRKNEPVEEKPEVDQPGIGRLRELVSNLVWNQIPAPARLWKDSIAGLNTAIANVPDGMANGVLAGVNPVHGLYASMMGPFVGGIAASSQLMIITTTAAASLTAGQSISSLSEEERAVSLFVMVVLAGIFQVLVGSLRLGNLTRFVSFSVTTGFLGGISILLIMNQLPVITGIAATGSNSVSRTANLLANVRSISLWPFLMAGFTFILAILLPRTRLGAPGRLLAIILPTLLVFLLGIESVPVVSDAEAIPTGLPKPFLPSLTAMVEVVTGAFSLSVVILVQGAGVSQSVPNPDRSARDSSRDFIAQGAANIASGLFRGLPVGGSLSTTALNLLAGARSRWSSVFAGIWMSLILLIFLDLVSHIIMPALGGLLILAGIRSIRPSEIMAVGNAGWPSKLAAVTTFLATLFLPIQAAVGIGVVLSALLFVNESSTDISVVELVRRPDGKLEEQKPSSRLSDNKVTVLDIYGNLFYAGARTLERKLPRPGEGARHPVVVLRLRGRTSFGATLVDVLAAYSEELRKADGRLYLTGVDREAYRQVIRSSKLRLNGPVRAYEVTPVLGESTSQAVAHARAWLVELERNANNTFSGENGEEKSGAPDRE